MAKQQPKPEKPAPTQHLTHAAAANQVVAAVTGKATATELAAQAEALVVAGGSESGCTYNRRRTSRHTMGHARGGREMQKRNDVLLLPLDR